MIVVVKRTDYKRLAIKVGVVLGLAVMFFLYYKHMSGVYSEFGDEAKKVQTEQEILKLKKDKKAQRIEDIIYDEAIVAVNLIGQESVQELQISGDRLLIVANPQVDIEPIMIRYGVLALVKNTKNDIKIAVDLASIVQSRYIDDEE
ncbi:hypothetical protein [Arcobacter sp. FWKO B]|uniref:hypothetical protein n=1 Tax=Arcobacter sp. FWKO B TaxID=2593672 RepID=UPI0018A6492B|nr:hypothetical protein [Arcobacter sp. FWKO B]QOG12388.1 hypothetical protein FWKOB_06605 [Arcobacter sp. FWKO B]